MSNFTTDGRVNAPNYVRFGTPYATAFQEAIINNSAASGNYNVIAGVAGQTIKIYRMFFIVGGTNTVTIEDGTTPLTGGMPFTGGGALVLDHQGEPWFTCSAGNAFNINSGSAIQVSGRVYYIQG